MYTRRFFVVSLGIPLVFLLLGIAAVFFISGKLPGAVESILVPYASFFLLLVFWAQRHSPREIRFAAYRAPIVYLIFQIGYLALEFSAGASLAKDIVGLGSVIIIVSTYIIMLGYLYVLLMEQAYFSYLFQKRRHRTLKENSF
jgi:hypothetical protein